MSGTYATVDVTFELPPSVAADSVAVVGDFNGWSRDASPMTRAVDGSFRLSLRLSSGRVYQYQYLIDGRRWANDWQADSYLPNSFGGDDSVVDLTEGGPRVHTRPPETATPTSAARADGRGAHEKGTDRRNRLIHPNQINPKVHENACT